MACPQHSRFPHTSSPSATKSPEPAPKVEKLFVTEDQYTMGYVRVRTGCRTFETRQQLYRTKVQNSYWFGQDEAGKLHYREGDKWVRLIDSQAPERSKLKDVQVWDYNPKTGEISHDGKLILQAPKGMQGGLLLTQGLHGRTANNQQVVYDPKTLNFFINGRPQRVLIKIERLESPASSTVLSLSPPKAPAIDTSPLPTALDPTLGNPALLKKRTQPDFPFPERTIKPQSPESLPPPALRAEHLLVRREESRRESPSPILSPPPIASRRTAAREALLSFRPATAAFPELDTPRSQELYASAVTLSRSNVAYIPTTPKPPDFSLPRHQTTLRPNEPIKLSDAERSRQLPLTEASLPVLLALEATEQHAHNIRHQLERPEAEAKKIYRPGDVDAIQAIVALKIGPGGLEYAAKELNSIDAVLREAEKAILSKHPENGPETDRLLRPLRELSQEITSLRSGWADEAGSAHQLALFPTSDFDEVRSRVQKFAANSSTVLELQFQERQSHELQNLSGFLRSTASVELFGPKTEILRNSLENRCSARLGRDPLQLQEHLSPVTAAPALRRTVMTSALKLPEYKIELGSAKPAKPSEADLHPSLAASTLLEFPIQKTGKDPLFRKTTGTSTYEVVWSDYRKNFTWADYEQKARREGAVYPYPIYTGQIKTQGYSEGNSTFLSDHNGAVLRLIKPDGKENYQAYRLVSSEANPENSDLHGPRWILDPGIEILDDLAETRSPAAWLESRPENIQRAARGEWDGKSAKTPTEGRTNPELKKASHAQEQLFKTLKAHSTLDPETRPPLVFILRNKHAEGDVRVFVSDVSELSYRKEDSFLSLSRTNSIHPVLLTSQAQLREQVIAQARKQAEKAGVALQELRTLEPDQLNFTIEGTSGLSFLDTSFEVLSVAPLEGATFEAPDAWRQLLKTLNVSQEPQKALLTLVEISKCGMEKEADALLVKLLAEFKKGNSQLKLDALTFAALPAVYQYVLLPYGKDDISTLRSFVNSPYLLGEIDYQTYKKSSGPHEFFDLENFPYRFNDMSFIRDKSGKPVNVRIPSNLTGSTYSFFFGDNDRYLDQIKADRARPISLIRKDINAAEAKWAEERSLERGHHH